MDWDKEELIGLGVLLVVIVGLVVIGKLTQEAVDSLKWIGGSFMASKGVAKIMPGNK